MTSGAVVRWSEVEVSAQDRERAVALTNFFFMSARPNPSGKSSATKYTCAVCLPLARYSHTGPTPCCTVLMWRIVGYPGTRTSSVRPSPIGLRRYYAMSGTERAYTAIRRCGRAALRPAAALHRDPGHMPPPFLTLPKANPPTRKPSFRSCI
eukprot:3171504-Rhodomonas_salina.1